MSDFKLEFTLRQHTPLIHFQHEQVGATLRATEVKARLDSFVSETWKLVSPKTWEKHKLTIQKEFPTIQGSPSGRYKLAVQPAEPSSSFIVANMIKDSDKNRLEDWGQPVLDRTGYFADAKPITDGLRGQAFQKGDFSSVRKGLEFDHLTLRFTFFNTALKALLNDVLPAFFSLNNFGTRQTKGFGCFLPEKNFTENQFAEILNGYPKVKAVYCHTLDQNEEALSKIQEDYQLIKSGRSYGGYKKSVLWEYLCANGQVSWEKRLIKQKLQGLRPKTWDKLYYELDKKKNPTGINRIADCSPTSSTFQYIRVLLGLAEQIEFMAFQMRDGQIQYNERGRPKSAPKGIPVKISDPSNEIERAASPVLFKVLGNKIYLIAFDPPSLLLERQGQPRKFTFNLAESVFNPRTREHEIKDFKLFDLAPPQAFNIADFFAFALDPKDTRFTKKINGYERIK